MGRDVKFIRNIC